jgi:prepilin-type processing-associated H-X9-DG protein
MKSFSNSIKHHFTIIEMIVVIAIFAMLVQLLFPMLHKFQSTAEKSHCSSNLRQFASAISLYTDDHEGWLPMALSPDSRPYRNGYIGELAPYLGLGDHPWVQTNHPFSKIGAPLKFSCVSENSFDDAILGYGWNWAGLGAYGNETSRSWGKRKNINEVAKPSLQSIIGESRPIANSGDKKLQLGTTLWWGRSYWRSAHKEFYYGQRHYFGSNYLLVDGHLDHDIYPNLIQRENELLRGTR